MGEQTAGGSLIFSNLAPGKYTVYSDVTGYSCGTAALEVKPGQVAKARIQVSRGGTIVFKLKETADRPISSLPWIGFRITDAKTGKPALKDAKGQYLGGVLSFMGDAPRQQSISVAPGEYLLDLVLKAQGGSWAILSHDNLWTGKIRVNVSAGKDTVVVVGK